MSALDQEADIPGSFTCVCGNPAKSIRCRLDRDQLVRPRRLDPALRLSAFDHAGLPCRRDAAGLRLSVHGAGAQIAPPSRRSAEHPRGSLPAGISEFPAVVGPMQQRLPLALPAKKITLLAIHLQLTDVPSDRRPAVDLSCIFAPKPPASIIAAVPLKPAARVFRMYPALPAPH
jgi:hypothetical protein